MNKQYAAIVGAGGQARVIASILNLLDIPVLGVFDDSHNGPEIIQGASVLGGFKDVEQHRAQIENLYLAIGDNQERKRFYDVFRQKGWQMPALVHPRAMIERDVQIKEASVVCVGSMLCVESRLGKGVIINSGCLVDHESDIGDFVHLAPKTAVAGRVSIGENTFVGLNSCIADRLTIGKNVTIGAGSVILKDVPDNSKIVGVFH